MIYKSCSVDEVIGRVIRNTRIQDSSYIVDMFDWIVEAMNKMSTQFELQEKFDDVNIVFHKGKLPCDLEYLEAVEYNGKRIGTSDTVKHYKTGHSLGSTQTENLVNTPTFQSIIKVEPNQSYFDENNLMYKSDIQPITTDSNIDKCDSQPSVWYKIELDYITTSFKNGTARLYYKARPTDKNGFPLIPDNENYKQALYYYVRSMMVGSGYLDKVFSYDALESRFELHARRAINEITYPTPDQKEQQVKAQVRFIPPANYWENFFRVDSPEQNFM